jgi:hypothetical protein
MKWLIKPIMRPIARRKLDRLYEDRRRIEAAISRARKAKGRVTDLYEMAKQVNLECQRLERWM